MWHFNRKSTEKNKDTNNLIAYNLKPLHIRKLIKKLGVVIHTCNPSYSGARDKRIENLKPVCKKENILCLNQKIKVMGIDLK
jgi:hypothetical protein